MKRKKTSNQDYFTHQGFHSDLKEKLKDLQTSKSYENKIRPALQQILMELLYAENATTRKKKILQMIRIISKGIYTVNVGSHPCINTLSKSEIVRRGGYKCRTVEMNLQLRDQQLNHIYIFLYQNFRVTLSQKSTVDTHTNKKNQLKYNTEDSHQTTRGEIKRRREEKKSNKNKSKVVNKMAIRTYI